MILSTKTIYLVFTALIALLALTILVAYINFGVFNFALALIIAVLKAVLIVLFFMEVRYRSRLTWIFAASGFVWLVVMLALTLSDYATRLWSTW
jgi:cytochrome c oxidase subunit IV